MASQKILNEKKKVVEEIVGKLKNSESVVVFQYQGLTVEDLSALRKELKAVNAEVRVYKNTLLKRAADELNINLDGFLEGPNAIIFGEITYYKEKYNENNPHRKCTCGNRAVFTG